MEKNIEETIEENIEETESEAFARKRREAFIEYQKTGKMNEIVRQEFEAYERQETVGTRRLVWGILALFLLAYTGLFGLFLWQYIHTAGKIWAVCCILWGINTVIAGYILIKREVKKKRG